ncbi:acyl-CoA thioesterase [Brucepastera parasyntrophica]|uniref:acyl-CoA thioesterase n=1 Tax=Brucepastera parasyntrophica TaxID=2880008 RepID=UPI002109D0F8|nr:acyl-CoA thioesterase [Brucepastera parasyntrophica]ULQ60841.1 acyl-CoA thioesterase [Brucepastera parasyntrophica]
MDTYTLVRTAHLNHNGKLFGGQLLQWVDEFAWLAAARDFPDVILVTRAMDNSEFRHSVANGSILRFHIGLQHTGTTSATYQVDVYAAMPACQEEKLVFSNRVVFVAIDEKGNKTKLFPAH